MFEIDGIFHVLFEWKLYIVVAINFKKILVVFIAEWAIVVNSYLKEIDSYLIREARFADNFSARDDHKKCSVSLFSTPL